MRIAYNLIPEEIKIKYKLADKVHYSHIYCKINNGIYGLSQTGVLANRQLTKRLAKHGYYPMERTPGLWKHETHKIVFALVVDDFGVKYTDTKKPYIYSMPFMPTIISK